MPQWRQIDYSIDVNVKETNKYEYKEVVSLISLIFPLNNIQINHTFWKEDRKSLCFESKKMWKVAISESFAKVLIL